MADHRLIGEYRARLARRLPADAVEELADGLTETYSHHLSRGLDADAAAAAAVAEFGEPDVVLAAFVGQSPGRRMAVALLYSGPAVGACWAATLVAGHAWTWPVPASLKATVGTTLLAVIGCLVTAATGRRSYRRTKVSVVGGLGLIVLDAIVLSTVLLTGVPLVWPMVVAVPASAARLALTTRATARLLVQR
jgi:hypothetical protein